MTKPPKHGGGPRSFDDAWRGLRNRKKKINQRNQQIRSLKLEVQQLESVNKKYETALDLIIQHSRAQDHAHVCWYCQVIAEEARKESPEK